MGRVVVTGIGIVSPIGTGRRAFWENALAGRSGVRDVTFADLEGLPARIGGRVEGFDPSEHLRGVKWKRLSRFVQFALAASFLAVEDAGLAPGSLAADRLGVFMGVSMSGMEMVEDMVSTWRERGPGEVKRYSATGSYPGAAAGNIAIELGLEGESLTFSTGCSSAATALGNAFRSLRAGEHDVILAGGAEACLTPSYLSVFGKAGILSKRNDDPAHASRPFDRDRDGYVLGEGGAVLVLETWSHAQKRGARTYAEVAGYGSTTDAYSMYAVEPEGRRADRAIAKAFRGTGADVSEVDYISAHGSSSVVSDRRETRVLRRTLGPDADRSCVSSIKSMIGHPLGACGGFQTAACALAMSSGAVHPTINYDHPDPECDLDYVPNEARESRPRAALSLSLGMGGVNAAIALKAV